MSLTPTKNRVFIETIVEEFAGRFILPRVVKDSHLPHLGIVRAIAAGAKAFGGPPEFKVGDKVVFNRHYQNFDNGLPVEGGVKLTIIDAEHVLAILKK